MSLKAALPYFAQGQVIKGFGRGSKALGIPTANFSSDVVETLPSEFETGIYCGWASLMGNIYKMVMSVGWNPFYKNKEKSMEVHILHNFESDFYGKDLKIIVLDYIRQEKDFSSIDELILAIKNDIKVANQRLEEQPMVEYKNHSFLQD